MDDDAVCREQARLTRQALQQAGLGLGQLWLHYFNLGGDVGELEVDAYLHHSLALPGLQRDLLAHAVNELVEELATPRAPYTSDLLPEHGSDVMERNESDTDDD